MKTMAGTLVILTCAYVNLLADEIVIQSFEQNGSVSFQEVPDAINYRVEWSPSVLEGWTNFTGDSGAGLDNIPPSGQGVITASVPMFYRVVASIPPIGMVYIPSGTFMMGNATNVFSSDEGASNELPQHAVYVDAFYMDKYEVSKTLWSDVRQPAISLGYNGFPFVASSNRPMSSLNWYNAVRWCNARSEVEGLTPVYYTESGFTNVYRIGEIEPFVDWMANGYRLPTEAEWEKAARGGIPDLRFPWSDFTNKISHAKANYYAGGYSYDMSVGYHPLYPVFNGGSPVESFAPNDYGLYNMAGNVSEWVWDWYDSTYYSQSPLINPLGPTNGTLRVVRGGHMDLETFFTRLSARDRYPPTNDTDIYLYIGFRCVRRP